MRDNMEKIEESRKHQIKEKRAELEFRATMFQD